MSCLPCAPASAWCICTIVLQAKEVFNVINACHGVQS